MKSREKSFWFDGVKTKEDKETGMKFKYWYLEGRIMAIKRVK